MVHKSHHPQHLRFHYPSFRLFLILFAIEVVIAVFFRDGWVRTLLGDVLVVMVIAYLIHAFFNIHLGIIAIGTLIFAYFIELLQFLKLIDILGWQDAQLAHLTLGSTFDWRDLVAYTIGATIVIWQNKSKIGFNISR